MGEADIKRYLDELHSDLKRELGETEHRIERRIKQTQDISIKSHEETRRQVATLSIRVDELWSTVKGSDPPPPIGGIPRRKDPSIPDLKPLDEQLSEHEAEIVTHAGRLLNIDGRLSQLVEDVASVKGAQENQGADIATVKELQIKQTHHMGIKTEADERGTLSRLVDGIIWMFKEPEGRKFSLAVFAAITSLVTAVGTTYALVSGRLPSPTQETHIQVPR